MATNESTATPQPHHAPHQPTAYAFEPVKSGHPEVDHANLPGFPVQRFADTVETVSTGAASILRLIEWDEVRDDAHECDPDTHPAPVLNDFHRSALLRLVAANMDMLADQADSLKNWAYRQHTAGGKIDQLADAMRRVQRHKPHECP